MLLFSSEDLVSCIDFLEVEESCCRLTVYTISMKSKFNVVKLVNTPFVCPTHSKAHRVFWSKRAHLSQYRRFEYASRTVL